MLDAINKGTRGKPSLRAIRYKHVRIREAALLRNRYLQYKPDEAAKLPELSVEKYGQPDTSYAVLFMETLPSLVVLRAYSIQV
jgi:hypothetical protein